METKRLDNAALAAGISPDYINAHGKPQSIAAATKQRLLDAMIVQQPPRKWRLTCRRCGPSHGKKMSLPVAGRGNLVDPHHRRGETVSRQSAWRGDLPRLAKLPEGYHSADPDSGWRTLALSAIDAGALL